MRKTRALLLALAPALTVALVACQSPAEPTEPAALTDGAMQSADLGTSPSECGECGDHKVCMNGACVALPETCPCPKESYCNLAANTCEVGCTADGECADGRICDAQSRKCHTGCRTDPGCKTGMICDKELCRAGCRMDSACAAGQICDNTLCRTGCRRDPDCPANQYCDDASLTCKAGCTADASCLMGQICDNLRCHAGCRNDAGCKSGQICESMKCRTGCRHDMDCGSNAICTQSKLTCTACTADPDRGKTTSVSTSGRSVSQHTERFLCGTSDVAHVTWTQGPPNPGYYRNSDSVTVSGATASGVTTIKLTNSGVVKTFTITGNGAQTIYNDSYDYYCFMGMCAGWTHYIEVSSTSDSPVKVEFNFYVSATR